MANDYEWHRFCEAVEELTTIDDYDAAYEAFKDEATPEEYAQSLYEDRVREAEEYEIERGDALCHERMERDL